MTPEQQHNIRNGVINIYVIARHLLGGDVETQDRQTLLRRILMECNRIGISAGIVGVEQESMQ